MAFVPQQVPEEEQNKFAPSGQTTPNPVPPQSGGSSGVGGQAKGTAPGVGSSTQFGSNAAKLSDYLAVNQPQIQNWGNQIAGNLSNNYNQTVSDVNKGFGSFNQQVQQGTPSADNNFISQAAQNPTDFVKNPDNVSKFQQAYQGNYKGPSNIESTEPYQNLNNEVNTAVQDAGLVGSTSGLGTYLNTKMGGANNETPGMQTLDTALLQGNPDAQSAIKGAAAPYQNLQTYLSGQTQQADTNAANAKNTTAQNAAQYQNQFTGKGGVVPTFQNDLTSRLGTASNSASTAANTAKADLLAGKPTADDLKLLGINAGQFGDLKSTLQNLNSDYQQPFDLSNYATMQDPSSVFSNPNSIATADDYAKSAALSQLTGADMSGYLNPAMAGNAGQQTNSLLNFNATGAQTDAGTALKQNDMNVLNNFLAPYQASGNGTKTIDDLVGQYLGKDTSRMFPTPAQNQQFQDALWRYQSGYAPTPNPVAPPSPTPTPIGFNPVGVQPTAAPIGFNPDQPKLSQYLGVMSPAAGIY